MKKWVKISILSTVVLIIIISIVASMNKSIKTDLYEVTKTDVTYKFKEKGISTSSGESKIFCPTSGDVSTVNVKEGDRVTLGEIIITLDTRSLDFQIKQLEAKISSLEGQKTSSSSTIKQQIAQLQNQLATVIQQEKEAYKGPLSSQLSQQQKVVDNAKAEVYKQRENYDRISSLFKNGAASKKDVEDADFAVKQAESNLAGQESALNLITEQASPVKGTQQFYTSQKKSILTQIDILNYELNGSAGSAYGQGKYYSGLTSEAQTNIEQLKDQINRSTITSPFNGIIKQISIQKGETVSPTTPVAVIIPNDFLSIDAYVLARDAIYFKPDDIVSIIQERKEQDATFRGHISTIAPAAIPKVSALGLEEQRVKVTVISDNEIPNIKPGYEFEIEFYPITQKDVIAVPSSAVFGTDNGDAVWVVKNKVVTLRNVEKGITAEEKTVIKSGLNEGEIVVKDSRQEGIKEKVKVK